MLHGGLHLSGFALPSAEPEEGHLHPVVQGEGGGHAAAQLQTDVLTAKCERLSRECSQRYVRQNQYLPYVPYVQVEPFPYLSRLGLLRMY